MKTLKTISALLICLSLKGQSPSLQWANGINGFSNQVGYGIDVDANGDVYSCGTFNASTDFDPGSGTTILTNLGVTDGYITKTDAAGNAVWSKQFGGTGSEVYNITLRVDSAGDILVAGSFTGTIDFDPGSGTSNLTSAGTTDIFFCKLDAAGNLLWAKRVGSTSDDRCYAVTLGPSGSFYLTGSFKLTVDFDPAGFTIFNMSSQGGADAYILKISGSGSFAWAKRIGGVNYDDGLAISSDASLGVLITGTFCSVNADFNPGTAVYPLSSNSSTGNIYVLKLNDNGSFLWAKHIGGTGTDKGTSIVNDLPGNVYISGTFTSSSVDFDPGTGTYTLSSVNSNNTDVFFLKLDAGGNFQWANQIGGANDEYCYSIRQDGIGILATGSFMSDTCDFDPGTDTALYFNSAAASFDAFVLKLDFSGNFIWAGQIGGNSHDESYAIVPDDYGNVYLTGYYSNVCDFEPGTGVSTLSAMSQADAFVCKLTNVSTGLNDNKKKSDEIVAYPNPCTDVLYVKSEKKVTSFSIINAAGQVVKSAGVNTDLIQINISDLPSGLYLLLCNDGMQKKILIK